MPETPPALPTPGCKVGVWLPRSGVQVLGVLAECWEGAQCPLGSPGSHPAASHHLPEVPVPGSGGCAAAVAMGLVAPGCSGTRRDVSET